MKALLRRVSASFGAGAMAVLIQQGVLWLLAAVGAGRLLGTSLSAGLSSAVLFPRLVWGGLFALLFLLPLPRASWWLRGLLFSLAPTLVWLGQSAGRPGAWPAAVGGSAFLGVLLANALWGLVAAWLLESGG